MRLLAASPRALFPAITASLHEIPAGPGLPALDDPPFPAHDIAPNEGHKWHSRNYDQMVYMKTPRKAT